MNSPLEGIFIEDHHHHHFEASPSPSLISPSSTTYRALPIEEKDNSLDDTHNNPGDSGSSILQFANHTASLLWRAAVSQLRNSPSSKLSSSTAFQNRFQNHNNNNHNNNNKNNNNNNSSSSNSNHQQIIEYQKRYFIFEISIFLPSLYSVIG